MKNTIPAFIALSLAASAQAQQAVQWKVSDGGNGHWYRFVSGPVGCFAWWQANAESSGAHLASIGSVSEQTFLGGLLPGATGGFVGGIRSPESDVNLGWTWVTGEPFSPTAVSWAPGNPGCCAPNEFWLRLLNNGLHDGAECENGTAAFFEWSADCNGDSVVDYGQCRDGTLPDYDSDNIPDCCESGTPCVIGSYPLQWRTPDGGNGHWYQVVIGVTDQSWEASRIAAGSRGGYLATLASEAENQWLHAVVVRHPSAFQSHGPWLGGYRSGSDWRWITDEAWLFAAWTPDNPSGDGVAMGYWEIGNPAAESWNDAPESNHMISFVAEWSADCNSDGIVDYGQILQGQLADANADGIPDICQPPTCVDADLFRDFNVDGADLGILLAQWGPSTPLTVSDINDDGIVDGADLGLLLSFWGACP